MPLECYVDVLIIGAGPAGLMCATALSKAGIDVRIIDKRPTDDVASQADGIAPRTIEVFQSYGLGERLVREGTHIHMATFYEPGRNGGVECTRRNGAVNEPTARYPFLMTLPQTKIEAIFLESMKQNGVEVERPKQPSALEISEDVDELSSLSAYPVKVTVERLDSSDDEHKTEIIHAKFVVGADGAHSWVRKTIGIEMEGEQTDYIWGVVDMVPETNFPDVRNRASIRSENGSCHIIPREGDKTRFYVQLSDAEFVNPLTGRIDKSRVNPQKILSAARKIMHPYELSDPKEIEWWTAYIIGQRVASSYSVKNRVFIAGDACHTHSPKAGQGMNASMNDTHNLAWKLAYILRGWSTPSLLATYEHERRAYAQDLIKFDKIYAALFSGKPKAAGNGGDVSHEALVRSFQALGAFFSGIGFQYSPSAIVDSRHQEYAQQLVIGKRMLPQIFVRASDTHPIDVQDLLRADARFKVLFFLGNLTSTRIVELNLLAEELGRPSSFLRRYSPDGNISTVFDIVTIIACKKDDMNHLLVPALFRPHWTKVLLDDTDVTGRQGGHAYQRFGVDEEQITLVVVRPDGYVGAIVPSTAIVDLEVYFGSFMVPRGLDREQCD